MDMILIAFAGLATGLAEALTAEQIADSLGVGRSAVLGRIKRLGDSGDTRFPLFRESAVHAAGKPLSGNPAPKQKPKPGPTLVVDQTAGLPLFREQDFHSRRLTLDQLRSTSCRWIDSALPDEEPTYCGNLVHARSYCARHHVLVYRHTERMPVKSLVRFANRFKSAIRDEVAA